jgi:hypothetical protein
MRSGKERDVEKQIAELKPQSPGAMSSVYEADHGEDSAVNTLKQLSGETEGLKLLRLWEREEHENVYAEGSNMGMEVLNAEVVAVIEAMRDANPTLVKCSKAKKEDRKDGWVQFW